MSETPDTPSVQEARVSARMALHDMLTNADTTLEEPLKVWDALDRHATAVRSERDAEIRGMVEGMVAQGYDDCSAGYALKCVLRLLSDREGRND